MILSKKYVVCSITKCNNEEDMDGFFNMRLPKGWEASTINSEHHYCPRCLAKHGKED